MRWQTADGRGDRGEAVTFVSCDEEQYNGREAKAVHKNKHKREIVSLSYLSPNNVEGKLQYEPVFLQSHLPWMLCWGMRHAAVAGPCNRVLSIVSCWKCLIATPRAFAHSQAGDKYEVSRVNNVNRRCDLISE